MTLLRYQRRAYDGKATKYVSTESVRWEGSEGSSEERTMGRQRTAIDEDGVIIVKFLHPMYFFPSLVQPPYHNTRPSTESALNFFFFSLLSRRCRHQPTQSEHLELKLNKQTVLYRLKIRFPHYSRYSHTPARNTSVNGAWMMPCGSRFQSVIVLGMKLYL